MTRLPRLKTAVRLPMPGPMRVSRLATSLAVALALGAGVLAVLASRAHDWRQPAVLGLLLGWYGLPYVLYGALAGNVLVVVIAIATSIRNHKVQLQYSFGPPLIAGALAVVLIHA
jgi:prepilin signal peptidase PulO-like enzyme (type II secretory pathway)